MQIHKLFWIQKKNGQSEIEEKNNGDNGAALFEKDVIISSFASDREQYDVINFTTSQNVFFSCQCTIIHHILIIILGIFDKPV